MDFSLIIGLLSGIGLIWFGIIGDGVSQVSYFLDPTSAAITFGGVIAATLISNPVSIYKNIPGHMKVLISKKKYDPKKYISKIVDYAQEARRKGLLALEDKANQDEEADSFFKNCVMLIVDAMEPAKTRELLENELDNLDARHAKGAQFYERAAAVAPAFGMIGTLIGLVNMLKGLDMEAGGAASQLSAGMSVALITTFYGSVLANLLLMPMANKLRARHEEEMLCKEMIVDGILAIQAGNNPRNIEERLYAYLQEKNRGSEEEGGKKGKRGAKAEE